MKRYIVTYKEKEYVYRANSAVEALDKLNNRKVYGNKIFFRYRLSMMDADTGGQEWAEGWTDEDYRIVAVLAETKEEND